MVSWRTWALGAALVLVAAPCVAVRSTPTVVRGLVGRGDVLAAATDGGVVVWELGSGAAHYLGWGGGLTSAPVNALALDEHDDVLLAATSSGLARGWWDGAWSPAPADSAAGYREFLCCVARPGGGFWAGGTGGLLAAWVHDRATALQLPATHDPIVALGDAARLLEAVAPLAGWGRAGPALAVTPAFPAGLVAGTDGGGVWLLRSTGVWTRWIQLTARDGLPSERVRALATDRAGRLWIATSNGLARVRRGLVVDVWPGDPLLGLEVLALFLGPDGRLYLGLHDGVAQLDPEYEHPCAQRVARTQGSVQALAWAGGELWWSEGARARAASGRMLTLGRGLHVAERLGARWQPTPRWPGASVVHDRGVATGTLRERAPGQAADSVRARSRR
jgi:hypothetical protein